MKYHMHSPIGQIEITGTINYISAIRFLDDTPTLTVNEKTTGLPLPIQKCIQELTAYFKGDLQQFSFPYQQQGTDFRQRVWLELAALPHGHTVSYLEISKRLSDVKAIRAAASANGKNQLAIVVPCHRVVGNDGSLTGYAGGLWRKKWLLEHENKYGGNAYQLEIF